MLSLTPAHIDAQTHDFVLFEQNETLGESLKPAFKSFLYACARDAFNEAWVRGLRWGWAQANLELNERANARMRSAFDFVYPAGVLQHAEPAPVQSTGVPRQDSLDLTWFHSVIGHISLAHLRVYGSVHNLQQKPIEQKFNNIVRFYQCALSLAWRAGWNGGEAFANQQLEQREQRLNSYDTIERQALEMEQEHLNKQMDTMFEVTDEDIEQFGRNLDARLAQMRPRP
jgi:hypothetical protein